MYHDISCGSSFPSPIKEYFQRFIGREKMSVLCEAAEEGSISRCRQLLAAGSDVEERDEDGFTPLLNAAYFGHTEVCELLLEKGKANIEETDSLGNTALNQAADEGDASTVALLLSKGARVDTRDKNGFTPLLAAAQKGHTEVCELLLDNGSDLEESSPVTQETALHKAAGFGHESLLQLLISQKYKPNLNIRTRLESTPLHLASQEGHLACVKKLLQAGADPLLPQVDGTLAIHKAADHNHDEVVWILLEQGGCSPDQVRHTALQSIDHIYSSFIVKIVIVIIREQT